MLDRCLMLVPLRSFIGPKTRLSDVLSPSERRDLVVALAVGVLEALDGCDVAVISDDAAVGGWAAERGLDVVRTQRPGLNAAATAGRDHARRGAYDHVALVPADLARPSALTGVIATATTGDAAVTAVADRHEDGTNLLVVPAAADFTFAYGPGSFRRHGHEARRLHLPFRAVAHAELAWDVDTPDDLERYRGTDGAPD